MTDIPFLIRGDEYLNKYHPNFKLVGRSAALKALSAILMRSHQNSVLLVGPGGVGCSALCLGLQASKGLNDAETNAPFDIVSKRLFWLDTDELFSSGDQTAIKKSFKQMMDTLYRTPDSVLIIEETKDFIEACTNNGTLNFINALKLSVKNYTTQIIIQCRDDDLKFLLTNWSDIYEYYTLLDLDEPLGQDLTDIVNYASIGLSKYHNITILPEAISAAIEMTTQYRNQDMGLTSAQPQRAITLIDRALATYRFDEHDKPTAIASLEATVPQSPEIKAWYDNQAKIKTFYRELREGEIEVIKIEQEIEALRVEEVAREANIDSDELNETDRKALKRFSSQRVSDSDEMQALKLKLANFQRVVSISKNKFEELTSRLNSNLKLTRGLILAEFSRLTGISVDKLDENQNAKLLRLADDLKKWIFGQDEACELVANSIKVLKRGRRTKVPTPWMFLGPSGVGKTEMAKSLARALMDDEEALTRFDMSEYMEKHAVARLIGAPPGYEGFEVGGILTNLARKNPRRIYLFDEIEKAHPDVFNVLLQILSDGRLTDGRGLTASFEGAIIIMTTNLGQVHFLTEESFEKAKELAWEDLRNTYRGEFLNRFNGRENIICFNKLGQPEIRKIVRREVNALDAYYSVEEKISVNMADDEVAAFSQDKYDPVMGARGLPGYIKTNLESRIINESLLGHTGSLVVRFDKEKGKFDISLVNQVTHNVALAS